jgi:hypothetical protein
VIIAFVMTDDNLTTDQMIRQIFASVKNIETSMSQVQSRVVVLEDNVAKLNRQVYDLQNVVNTREQELKSQSVRVTGFPFTEEERASTDGKYLSKKIYDRILTPILNQAKTKNHIERVPTLANTIQSCFRVGQAAARTGTGAPPPVILKLSSDVIKLAIMRNKRQATPAPTPEEKNLGITRFIVSEDLTPPCFRLLKDLQRNEEVGKVWTVDGRIRWMLKDSNNIHRVKSVFDSVESIISKAKA